MLHQDPEGQHWYCGDCWADYDASQFCSWAGDTCPGVAQRAGEQEVPRAEREEDIVGTEEGGALWTLVEMGFGIEEASTALCAAEGEMTQAIEMLTQIGGGQALGGGRGAETADDEEKMDLPCASEQWEQWVEEAEQEQPKADVVVVVVVAPTQLERPGLRAGDLEALETAGGRSQEEQSDWDMLSVAGSMAGSERWELLSEDGDCPAERRPEHVAELTAATHTAESAAAKTCISTGLSQSQANGCTAKPDSWASLLHGLREPQTSGGMTYFTPKPVPKQSATAIAMVPVGKLATVDEDAECATAKLGPVELAYYDTKAMAERAQHYQRYRQDNHRGHRSVGKQRDKRANKNK